MRDVIVVTNTELGWDCIVGVFDAVEVSKSELETRFSGRQYRFFFEEVENSLDEWE